MTKRTCLYRCSIVFHVLVAALSILAGVALFALTIFSRRFVENAQASSGGPTHPTFSLSLAFCITLIVFGLASLLAARRHCVGVTFRVIYLLSAIAFVGVLGYFFVTAMIALRKFGDAKSEFQDNMEDTWTALTTNGTRNVCSMQYTFKCRGLFDGDCDGCQEGKYNTTCKVPTRCPDCSKFELFQDMDVSQFKGGCISRELAVAKSFVTAYGTVSGLLLCTVVLDVCLTCFLPLHVADLILRSPVDEDADVTP